ncbi:MAG: tetratricopeptide repeat protein [Streptosporangiaceae bacterium]
MEFRTLGPIELWSAGQPHDLGSARLRCALAVLLLAPRTIVPAETLIDRLWDTQPPPKARESLSVYMARLRVSLRQAVGDNVQLIGRTRGYVLQVDPDAIDVHQFRRLRRQADSLAASGDHARAAELLHEADGLWHGQALTGIRGDWVERMRDSLEEERRAALLERVECELALGRHADLVGELHHLLAQYPLDETFIGHQMTALYRSGRPGDALSLYRDTRHRLVEEQGTEPGSALAELHQRILGRDPALAVNGAAPRQVRATPTDTLPPETAPFVGRGEELTQLLGPPGPDPRVVVIEGMPGVGKTALAVHAARQLGAEYPDGRLYLNLQAHDTGRPSLDAAEALHRLLRMLAVPAEQIPDLLGDRVTLWRAQLSRRQAVVILDDVTQHDQIRPLLPATGQSLILVTTRRRLLGLGDARTLTLDVLSRDDAVALFRRDAGDERARDSDQVADVVNLCGRLPLAIQLTAGRAAHDQALRLGDLIGELSQSPTRLGGTGAASPEVISAFDLSYGALEPDHQRFFRRLGVSPCASFGLPAAAALSGVTLAEAEKALATLLDHHLLARAPDDQFRFHDLIRGYAAVRAARDDPETEQRQAVGRLLGYYLDATTRALETLGRREDATAWLEAEWRNILQAARHAGQFDWKRTCTDLTHLLAELLEIKACWDDAISAHTLALKAARDLADPGRIALASLDLSAVYQQLGRHDASRPPAEEAAGIYRSLADRGGEAKAVDRIGMAHQRVARSREALAYFHEAQNLYEEAGDQLGVAAALGHAGIACWHLGRGSEALEHLKEAVELYGEAGERRGEAKALNNLGRVHLYCGYHRDALESYERSLQIFKEIGGKQNQAILHHNIGSVYHYKGSYEEGLAHCRQALTIYREIGDLPDEADVLNDIGAIYQSAACYEEALVHHENAHRIAEQTANLPQQLVALRRIADIHRGSGRYEQAVEHYRTALGLVRELGDAYEEGKILEGIAECTLSTQRPDAARIVFRQALDIFDRLGVPEAESARIRIETIDPSCGLRISS